MYSELQPLKCACILATLKSPTHEMRPPGNNQDTLTGRIRGHACMEGVHRTPSLLTHLTRPAAPDLLHMSLPALDLLALPFLVHHVDPHLKCLHCYYKITACV